jgi:hypothetical protein
MRQLPKEKLPKRFVLAFLLLWWAHSPAPANQVNSDSLGQFKQNTVLTKVRCSVDFFGAQLKRTNIKSEGVGVQGGILFGVTEVLGVGALVSQVIIGEDKPYFTQISLEARWALIGSLIRRHETHSLNGRTILDATSGNSSGLMLHGFIHQRRLVGSPGFGGGLSYEHPLSEQLSLRVGFRSDYASDGSGSYTSYQAFSGLAFWL